MTVLVTDASVLVVALADDGQPGDSARARLRGEVLVAPEVVDLEVLSALRSQWAAGTVDRRRVELALADLRDLRLRRVPHQPLLVRCWELRENVSVYDASYVALAEILDATLLTADARLASAPGPRCSIEVLQ